MADSTRARNTMLIFAATLGGVLYGYDIGAMPGVLMAVVKEMGITGARASLFASVFFWGGALAMLVTGVLADALGRKKMMVASSVVFLASIVLIVLARGFAFLVLARLVLGFAIGILTVTIPLYVSEAMPAAKRGRGTVAFQLLLTSGILLSTLVALAFASTGWWRGIFLCELVPGCAFLLISLRASESPRWLADKGRLDEARAVLLATRSPEEADAELSEMRASASADQAPLSLSLLRQRRYLLPVLLAVGVGVLNQLNGINSILQYDGEIMRAAGLDSDMGALMGSSLVALVNFLMTIVAIVLVDRVERNTLLRVGAGAVALVLAAASAVFFLLPQGHARGQVVMACLLAFIVFFAVGPGAICWTVMSEVLPSKVRSKGLAAALFLNSVAGAALSTAFLPLKSVIGFGGLFAICAAFTFIYFLVGLALPATRGKSLEEIEADFAAGKQ